MVTSLRNFGGTIIASNSVGPGTDSYTLGPPLPQERPKPPFRPKVAGRVGFFFGIVAGALVSVINLRRMGHPQKAKKVMWITLLATVLVAAIFLLSPNEVGRLVGLVLEVLWYFVFPKIQDQEFGQWAAAHKDMPPSNGWKALGWGFVGLLMLFAIGVSMSILLVVTGILPP